MAGVDLNHPSPIYPFYKGGHQHAFDFSPPPSPSIPDDEISTKDLANLTPFERSLHNLEIKIDAEISPAKDPIENIDLANTRVPTEIQESKFKSRTAKSKHTLQHPAKLLLLGLLPFLALARSVYIGLSTAGSLTRVGMRYCLAALNCNFRTVKQQHIDLINTLKWNGIITPPESLTLKINLGSKKEYNQEVQRIIDRLRESQTFENDILNQIQKALDWKSRISRDRLNQMNHLKSPNTPRSSLDKFYQSLIRDHLQNMALTSSKTGQLRNKLLLNLEKNQKEKFLSNLHRFHRHLAADQVAAGNKVAHYALRELNAHLQKRTHLNPFIDFGQMLQEKEFYEAKDQYLMDLCQSIETLILESDKTKSALGKTLKTRILGKKIQQLQETYGELLADYRYLNKRDVQYGIDFGNYNQKFRVINDMVDELLARVERSPRKHRHITCSGCQFSYRPGYQSDGVFPIDSHNTRTLDPKQIDIYATKYILKTRIYNKDEELRNRKAHFADAKGQLDREKQFWESTPSNDTAFRIKHLEKTIESMQKKHDAYVSKMNKELAQMKSRFQEMAAIEWHESHIQAGPISSDGSSIQKPSFAISKCNFGKGHIGATTAISQAIGKKGGHVSIIESKDDVLLKRDPLYKYFKMIGLKFKESDLFNLLQDNRLYWIMNANERVNRAIKKIFGVKGNPFTKSSPQNKDLLRNRLLLERPDYIINSGLPFDLNSLLEVAEELGIPVIHTATDFDTRSADIFEAQQATHPYFKFFIPGNTPGILKKASFVASEQRVLGTLPSRLEFSKRRPENEILALKQARGIDPEAEVVIVLSGGNGQMIDYPEYLANSKTHNKKRHLIVIAGKNTDYAQHLIRKLENDGKFLRGKNPHVTIEIAKDPCFDMTDDPYFIGPGAISEIMDIADYAYSTRGGGGFISEMLKKGIFVIFDCRQKLAEWEDFNIKQVVLAGRGILCKRKKDIEKLFERAVKAGKKSRTEATTIEFDKLFCETASDQLKRVAKDPVMQSRKKYANHFSLRENL